jgi:hypothetical protein
LATAFFLSLLNLRGMMEENGPAALLDTDE